MGDVDADAGLASAGVEHIGVRGAAGERADGGRLEIAVGDIAPELTTVFCFPDAAADRAEIESGRVVRVARYGDDTAAAERADATEVKLVVGVFLTKGGLAAT